MFDSLEEKLVHQRLAFNGINESKLNFPKVGNGSLEDLRDTIRDVAVQKLGAKYVYVVATYGDHVVISTDETDGKALYYKIPYSVKNGTLELGDPTKVKKVVEFQRLEAVSRRVGLLSKARTEVDNLMDSNKGQMQKLAGVGVDLDYKKKLVENRRGLPELKEVYRGKLVLLEDEKIEEGKVVKPMLIGGVATQGNVGNENTRYYRTETWGRQCEVKQEVIKSGKLLGELDHPDDGKSRLEKTSVRYTKLEMDGDYMNFEAAVLETPSGDTLKALLRGGVGVDISTRGFGSTKKETIDGKEWEVVQDDYELAGIDQVVGHSNLSAEIQYYQEKANNGEER